MVEAMGWRISSSGSIVPGGSMGTVSPRMSRTSDHTLSVSDDETLS